MGQKKFHIRPRVPKNGLKTAKKQGLSQNLKKNEPNSIGRSDFSSKPQSRHAGRSRAPYEPCSAKIGDPGGFKTPIFSKKWFLGEKKGISAPKLQSEGDFFFIILEGPHTQDLGPI